MGGFLLLLYSAVAYLVFFGAFLYAIGFVGCIGVPKCVDTGAGVALGHALLIDAALLGAFAVQHTIMARRWFKHWWTKFVPKPAERSTFVLVASLLLLLLFWQWQPLSGRVWNVSSPAVRATLWGIFALGWMIVLFGSYMIDHFDLFGLRQAWLHFRGRPYTHPPFKTTALYRYTRNPLMLGFIIAFWATPTMTMSHLLFAAASTGYILVGIMFEERDHAFYLGERYERYRARTPMLIPRPPRPEEEAVPEPSS
jgi:protein-S-isoprenylcysteine O-methyltransferase Ste14